MLSNNDVQLFYRLLDSLGSSLKELAIKYELLVRASDGNAKGVSDLSKEILGLGRSFDKIETSIGDAKEKATSGFVSIEKTIEKCNKEMAEIREAAARIYNASSVGAGQAAEIASAVRHLDDHMDACNRALGEISGKLGDLGDMRSLKKDLEPVIVTSKALNVLVEAFKEHLRKPMTLLLVIYVLLASLVAFSKATTWFWKQMPEIRGAAQAQSATNSAAPQRNAVSGFKAARP